MSKEYMNDGSLSEKWKYRFNFYDQHGFPGFWGATPEYKAAFKALKVRQRLTIQMNFIAFFCSCIYLFVLDHTIFLYYKIKSKKEILFSIPMFLFYCF